MKEKFVQRLHIALNKSGMKQNELAEKSGLSKSRICRYMKGEYMPKQDSAMLLAKALNVSPGWLLGFGDNPSPDAAFVNVNLSFSEHQMMTEYRLLNDEGRQIVNDVINSVRKRKCLNRS